MTAKVVGELSRSFDPAVSEWRNPSCFAGEFLPKRSDLSELLSGNGEPPELKHLSRARNINQRDCLSSGERNGSSLNHLRACTRVGLRDFNVRPCLIVEWPGMANHRE